MADKFNDQEIYNELKRFGETIKLPIDSKKRPILIKKLNHYYAKENPPPKRGRSAKQTKKYTAPAEFSDDSQDESENNANISLNRDSPANSLDRDSTMRSGRNRLSDTGFGRRGRRHGANKKNSYRPSTSRHQEVYPAEFSDDTEDESVLEIEEKSVGINTSLNYDNSFHGEVDSRRTGTSTTKGGNPKGNSYVTQAKKDKQASFKKGESGHFVSKSILLCMAVFFLALALGYLYVRSDSPSQSTSIAEKDLIKHKFCDDASKDCTAYTEAEVNDALLVLKKLYAELASRKGKFELGVITNEDMKRMSRTEMSDRMKLWNKNETSADKMVNLCFSLILAYPQWEILAFGADGTGVEKASEVEQIESIYGDLSVLTRLYLSLYKVVYGLALVLVCVCIGVLGIYYLKWQNKRREKVQQKVYDMVEQIIELLKDHSEVAEQKNDPKAYPPYLAKQHVRDQLIPVSKRKQMQKLWDEAVSFIETNESRIRVETQVIQGEEFTVWRWLQAIPNGHKMWQGQAFGETSHSNVNTLPYGPTPCLKVRNMFDANVEKNADDWHIDIEESILEKCENNNGILHIYVDRSSKEGCVYIKCSSCQKAFEAFQALHGWWFDSRLITVKYLRLEHYHDRFPDSRNRKYPLRPSSSEMQSVSRPYHRSALEMT